MSQLARRYLRLQRTLHEEITNWSGKDCVDFLDGLVDHHFRVAILSTVSPYARHKLLRSIEPRQAAELISKLHCIQSVLLSPSIGDRTRRHAIRLLSQAQWAALKHEWLRQQDWDVENWLNNDILPEATIKLGSGPKILRYRSLREMRKCTTCGEPYEEFDLILFSTCRIHTHHQGCRHNTCRG